MKNGALTPAAIHALWVVGLTAGNGIFLILVTHWMLKLLDEQEERDE